MTSPVTHIFGGHIELDAVGRVYSMGSQYHPNERSLQLAKDDLLALLPAALEGFNGFYATHTSFILYNPIHILLAVTTLAVAALILIVWGVRRLLQRRRRNRT